MIKFIKEFLYERRKNKLSEKIFCALLSNPTVYNGGDNHTMPFDYEEDLMRVAISIAETFLKKHENINEPKDYGDINY